MTIRHNRACFWNYIVKLIKYMFIGSINSKVIMFGSHTIARFSCINSLFIYVKGWFRIETLIFSTQYDTVLIELFALLIYIPAKSCNYMEYRNNNIIKYCCRSSCRLMTQYFLIFTIFQWSYRICCGGPNKNI